ncbi:hypothetical protein Cni_G10250 [Canna indica]|uniref:CCHC-type domain-containing protein n=1 Tax=Canna indica TaxID=4628 RepID=A0AAQ3K3X0_9LILI|nr:hypothetical protein Cni_G10250 [Canna indica]
MICFTCGRIGHSEEKCLAERAKNETKKDSTLKNQGIEEMEEEKEKLLGPWIQVQKRNRRIPNIQKKGEEGLKNSFVVLDNPTFEKTNGNAMRLNESSRMIDQGKKS